MAKSSASVKILGGGQLALMLAESARSLGVEVVSLALSNEDPVAKIFRQTLVGSLSDKDFLQHFLSRPGPTIFESDFLPYDLLRPLATSDCIPSLKTMEHLSDKLEQKKVLAEAGIESPGFEAMSPQEEALGFIERVSKRWPRGFVIKWARGGYDGKGVLISSSDNSVQATQFVEAARGRGVEVFAEEKIVFVRELAQVCVYARGGEFKFYPLVVSKQKSGICDFVFGPAQLSNAAHRSYEKILSGLQRLAKSQNLFGCFALEMFETFDGHILANEIAPRVHNSGHFTLSCSLTSQFENHIRAILGMPLGETKTAEFFLMKNILGSRSVEIAQPPRTPNDEWQLKWYEKNSMRPGRKMGHINLVRAEPFDVQAAEREMADWIDRWVDALPKTQ